MTSALEHRIREVLYLHGADAAADEIVAIVNHSNRKKLSDIDVRSIRLACRQGSSQAEVAELFGINPATVSRIVRGIYY